VITLDNKAYFWEEFDDDNNPTDPKECQILFTPNNGGILTYLMDIGTDFFYEDYKDKTIERLYGKAKNGEKFTLLNLVFIGVSLEVKFDGLTMVELDYSVEFIFYGAWMKDSDIKLPVIYARYSYLEAWFKQMEAVGPYDVDDKIMSQIIIHKESFQCSTKDYEVIFNINNELNQHSINGNSVTYDSKNFLAMTKKEPFTLSEAMALSLKVKSFFEILTFYSQKKIFIEELKIQKDEIIGDYPSKQTVYILFKQEGYSKEEEMSSQDFLFTYASIRENFVEVLNHWIDNYDKNRNEFSAFCNVIADKDSKFNIYSHFFQLISSLEGYHRKNTIIDEGKKKRNREKICNLVSQLEKYSDKKQILEKFKYDYEPNFRKRLNDLIILSDVKSIITLNNKAHKSIANLIYTMRNDIAHSNKSIIVNDKIEYTYEYLKLVALLIMVKDISLDQKEMSKYILEIHFKHLKDNLEKAFTKEIK